MALALATCSASRLRKDGGGIHAAREVITRLSEIERQLAQQILRGLDGIRLVPSHGADQFDAGDLTGRHFLVADEPA